MHLGKYGTKVMFWQNKKVFITGHSGFKGGWLALWLSSLGADVCGFSKENNEKNSFFNKTNLKNQISKSIIGDIRDFPSIDYAINTFNPDIIFHLAAQPLVRDSYLNPVLTYETNIMGTINVFEAARKSNSTRAIINITTDKCYKNNEWDWPYRENDRLGGRDPYSSSKACSEIISSAYKHSFFSTQNLYLATARAGNVIGGGDWSKDRLIPDFFRNLSSEEKIMEIRYPFAIRPWQHVLESLNGYIKLAENLLENGKIYEGGWNFGPYSYESKTVSWIMDFLQKRFPEMKILINAGNNFHESKNLKLDISKSMSMLPWEPKFNIEEALNLTIEWYKLVLTSDNENMLNKSLEQIEFFENKNLKDA